MVDGVLLDLDRADDVHVDRRLREEPVVWLGTVCEGRPRTVPVWFWWTDPVVTVFCDPTSHKVADLRENGAVSLALDTAAHGTDVVIGHGDAQLLTLGAVQEELAQLGAKYAAMLGGGSVEDWVQGFSQPVQVTLTRLIAWQRGPDGVRYRSVGA